MSGFPSGTALRTTPLLVVLFTESPMRTWDDLRCSTVSSTWPSSRPRPSRQAWLGHQKIAVGQPPNLQRRPFLRWGNEVVKDYMILYDHDVSWCIMMWYVYLISGPFSQNRDFAHRNTSRWGQWRVNLGRYCGAKKKRNWVSWWHLTPKLGLSIGCSALINYFC